MKEFVYSAGKEFVILMRYIGATGILFARTVGWLFIPPLRRHAIIEQMQRIGVASLPIASLVALFTGMVLAFQSAYQMQKISAEMYIASLVALSMTRELGPVLTALVVAGRVGASITAELGTMKVTEQVEALETLAANPVKYLVVPRMVALALMVPLLTIYADLIGMIGGYLVGVGKLHIGHSMYVKMTWQPMFYKDVFTGLVKAFFFGLIICMISCYEGLRAHGGAEGVGHATTSSVVTSFVLIIASDCLFTIIFYFVF